MNKLPESAIEILETFKDYLFEDHDTYCGFKKRDFNRAINEIYKLHELNKSKENEICKNCEHFNSEYKECSVLTTDDWDCYYDQPTEDKKLIVEEDFGCKKWEKKD